VQSDREELALHQPLEERAVDVPHVVLEHVVEIPDWLMEVDAEDEPQGIQSALRREPEPRGDRSERGDRAR
jgi:hypothetical protein